MLWGQDTIQGTGIILLLEELTCIGDILFDFSWRWHICCAKLHGNMIKFYAKVKRLILLHLCAKCTITVLGWCILQELWKNSIVVILSKVSLWNEIWEYTVVVDLVYLLIEQR